MNARANLNNKNELVSILRRSYQDNSFIMIEYLMYERDISIDKFFINLAIVNSVEQKIKDEELRKSEENRSKQINLYENIYSPKKPIMLNNIFDKDLNEQEPRHIFIEGRAGIGKTILAKYLAYQWSVPFSEEIINPIAKWRSQYEIVILISLRDVQLYESDSTEVEQFIYRFCLWEGKRIEISYEQFKSLLNHLEKSKKVLYIFDGYDEAADILDKKPILKRLFLELLDKDNWIITSRPGYVNGKTIHGKRIDRRLENIGFTQENVYAYVYKFFEFEQKDKAERLIVMLRVNSSIRGVAHIPVVLELICSMWAIEEKPINDFTLTKLYYNIYLYIIKRYLKKFNIDVDITDKAVFAHEKSKDVINFFESLAWDAMQRKGIIVRSQLIQDAYDKLFYNQPLPNELKIWIFKKFGLIKEIDDGRKELFQKDYYFVHLTFEEFCAARYICSHLDEVELIIKSQNLNHKYEIIWWFVAGTIEKPQDLDKFYQLLINGNKDLTDIYQTKLIIQCSNESRDKTPAWVLESIVAHLIKLFTDNQKDHNKLLLHWLKDCPYLLYNQIFKSAITNLLNDLEIYDKSALIDFLVQVKYNDTDVIKKLIEEQNKSYYTNNDGFKSLIREMIDPIQLKEYFLNIVNSPIKYADINYYIYSYYALGHFLSDDKNVNTYFVKQLSNKEILPRIKHMAIEAIAIKKNSFLDIKLVEQLFNLYLAEDSGYEDREMLNEIFSNLQSLDWINARIVEILNQKNHVIIGHIPHPIFPNMLLPVPKSTIYKIQKEKIIPLIMSLKFRDKKIINILISYIFDPKLKDDNKDLLDAVVNVLINEAEYNYYVFKQLLDYIAKNIQNEISLCATIFSRFVQIQKNNPEILLGMKEVFLEICKIFNNIRNSKDFFVMRYRADVRWVMNSLSCILLEIGIEDNLQLKNYIFENIKSALFHDSAGLNSDSLKIYGRKYIDSSARDALIEYLNKSLDRILNTMAPRSIIIVLNECDFSKSMLELYENAANHDDQLLLEVILEGLSKADDFVIEKIELILNIIKKYYHRHAICIRALVNISKHSDEAKSYIISVLSKNKCDDGDTSKALIQVVRELDDDPRIIELLVSFIIKDSVNQYRDEIIYTAKSALENISYSNDRSIEILLCSKNHQLVSIGIKKVSLKVIFKYFFELKIFIKDISYALYERVLNEKELFYQDGDQLCFYSLDGLTCLPLHPYQQYQQVLGEIIHIFDKHHVLYQTQALPDMLVSNSSNLMSERHKLFKIQDRFTSIQPVLPVMEINQIDNLKKLPIITLEKHIDLGTSTHNIHLKFAHSSGNRTTRESSASFWQSAQSDNREPLHNLKKVQAWLKDILSDEIKLGTAISKGDCFFDAIAQGLNQKEGKEEYDVKSLRLLCDEYAKNLKNSWVEIANKKNREDHNSYLVRIQFTSEELVEKEKQGLNLGTTVWGRPKIEGRIFCEKFNIKLHVIKIQEDGAVHRYLVNKNGETEDYNPAIDYSDNNIIHLVNHHNHYVPLIKSGLVEKKEQLSRTNFEKHSFSPLSKSLMDREEKTEPTTDSKYPVPISIPGLSFQKVPGDGHCLFHAVALYTGRDQADLRSIVADHLENNTEDFKEFINLPDKHSIKKYIQAIRTGKEWAEHIEIEVLMKVLNRPIIIIDHSGFIRNQDVLEKELKGEVIFVLYNGHNHYDALIKTVEYSLQGIQAHFPKLNFNSRVGCHGNSNPLHKKEPPIISEHNKLHYESSPLHAQSNVKIQLLQRNEPFPHEEDMQKSIDTVEQKSIFAGPKKEVKHWHIPEPNLYFIERNIVYEIANNFKEKQFSVSKQVLVGLGGVGKTALAASYCYYAIKGGVYNEIAWFNAETDLAGEFRHFARECFNLPVDELKDFELVKAIYSQFDQHKKYLLIFDNVESNIEFIKYLPSSNNQRFLDILITSRNQSWNDEFKLINLGVFSKDEAVAYIQKALSTCHQYRESESNNLAEVLGCLPLALKQATAYIGATGITIKSYIENFNNNKDNKEKLLSYLPKPYISPTSSENYYRLLVMTTWDKSLFKISSESPQALEILKLCAFLSPECISRILLQKLMISTPTNADNLDMAIALIHQYSLIEFNHNGDLQIHRLVQEIIKLQLFSDENILHSKIKYVLKNISEFDKEQADQGLLSNLNIREDLIPHYKYILERLLQCKVIDSEFISLCYEKLSDIYYDLHYTSLSCPYYEKALEWYLKSENKRSERIAYLTFVLARSQRGCNLSDKAENNYKQSLKYYNDLNSTYMLTRVYNYFSKHYCYQDNKNKAFEMAENAEINLNILMANNENDKQMKILKSENYLAKGNALFVNNNYIDAEKYVNQAINIRKEYNLFRELATSYKMLSLIQEKLKKWDEAVLSLEEAKRYRIKCFGEKRGFTLVIIRNIGNLYKCKYNETKNVSDKILCIENYMSALNIVKDQTTHITFQVYRDIGHAHLWFNELLKAKHYIEKALEIRLLLCQEKNSIKDETDIATQKISLGEILIGLNEFEKAFLLLHQGLKTRLLYQTTIIDRPLRLLYKIYTNDEHISSTIKTFKNYLEMNGIDKIELEKHASVIKKIENENKERESSKQQTNPQVDESDQKESKFVNSTIPSAIKNSTMQFTNSLCLQQEVKDIDDKSSSTAQTVAPSLDIYNPASSLNEQIQIDKNQQ